MNTQQDKDMFRAWITFARTATERQVCAALVLVGDEAVHAVDDVDYRSVSAMVAIVRESEAA